MTNVIGISTAKATALAADVERERSADETRAGRPLAAALPAVQWCRRCAHWCSPRRMNGSDMGY
jgi:hypothetical protein